MSTKYFFKIVSKFIPNFQLLFKINNLFIRYKMSEFAIIIKIYLIKLTKYLKYGNHMQNNKLRF